MTRVTAIFDIGKTNKKFFLFDDRFEVVHCENKVFKEISDDEGFPEDDLSSIVLWIKEKINIAVSSRDYYLDAVNFSTYGASMVHLGVGGSPITPFYNYLKKVPSPVLEKFMAKYGDGGNIAVETASPISAMLNSGLQMFWLKETKPDVFCKIKHSLHLPQYLSFIFSGIPVSDYTSIGCHTLLWDYKNNKYHNWVYKEGLDLKLAPIVPTSKCFNSIYAGRKIRIGVGIHDSSASLVPYLNGDKSTFALLSTGTWNVTMNPFNRSLVSRLDLDNNCLSYMQVDGVPLKASRLFLGNEHQLQVKRLDQHFGKDENYSHNVKFDKTIFLRQRKNFKRKFRFETLFIDQGPMSRTNLQSFHSYEEAYHQLMLELIILQFDSSSFAIQNADIKTIYIEGGFCNNDLFVRMAAHYFGDMDVKISKLAIGSALGAAMIISTKKTDGGFLEKYCGLEISPPLRETQ